MSRDVFIPDPHADVDALRSTLLHARLARNDRGRFVLQESDLHELGIKGDYIGRGDRTFETIELAMELRDTFKRVFLQPGNHEIAMFQALTHAEPRWMEMWLSGLGFLTEVAERYRLAKLSEPTTGAHPLAQHDIAADDPYTELYLRAWRRAIEAHPEWQMVDFPAAYGRARELFIDDTRSSYHIFFRQLQYAHRIGAILSVHAGMNEVGWEMGIEGLQQRYERAWDEKEFRPLHDYDYDRRISAPDAPLSDLVCMTKPLPPSEEPLLSKGAADMLLRDGIRVLMHGHAVLLHKSIANPGVQQCNNAHGIADMNGDIGMSSGFLSRDPKKPSDWGFIQYDRESGQFTAHNPKTGPLDFGTLMDGEYTFPSGT